VGLGGYAGSSPALEQIGTDADCSSSGHASYYSWFELLPAAAISIPIRIQPGDQVTASATVAGHHATLRVRDLTSGARFSVTRRAASIDVSSADWIVEAPSVCSSSGCGILALTDFGNIAFSSATAVAAGHTGTVIDPAWHTTAIELRQSAGRVHGRSVRPGTSATTVVATPSTAPSATGAFSVTWSEERLSAPPPTGPALPGFEGSSG
jgi:hypothetical protein